MIELNTKTLAEARGKLGSAATREEGMTILKKMKEIIEGFEWRSGAMASCCTNLDPISCKMGQELELIEKIIGNLENGNQKDADAYMDKLHEQLAEEIGMPSEMVKKIESGG